MSEVAFEDLFGKTLVSVKGCVGDDEIVFTTEKGEEFKMYHAQDCCEDVRVEDICGDLEDLVGVPILCAYEESNYEGPVPEYAESYTWTFYVLATEKGRVTIRRLGESNGYYSESVDFVRTQEERQEVAS